EEEPEQQAHHDVPASKPHVPPRDPHHRAEDHHHRDRDLHRRAPSQPQVGVPRTAPPPQPPGAGAALAAPTVPRLDTCAAHAGVAGDDARQAQRPHLPAGTRSRTSARVWVLRKCRETAPQRDESVRPCAARRSSAWMPMTSMAKMPQVEPARKTAMIDARTRIMCDPSSRKARTRRGGFGRSATYEKENAFGRRDEITT